MGAGGCPTGCGSTQNLVRDGERHRAARSARLLAWISLVWMLIEGTQNYLCAAQAAAGLIGLAITGAWSGGWWIDPVIGLVVAAKM